MTKRNSPRFIYLLIIPVIALFVSCGSSKNAAEKTEKSYEGKIIYSMEFSSDDPQVKQQLFMMKGSEMTIAYKDNKIYNETSMGSMMNNKSIINKKDDKMLMLASGMGGKKAAVKEGLDEDTDSTKGEDDIQKTEETQEILGYICTKYVAKSANGVEQLIWATDEISTPKMDNSRLMADKLSGTPLMIEIDQERISIKIKAKDYQEKISEEEAQKLFDMSIPEDYEKVPYEELRESMRMGQ